MTRNHLVNSTLTTMGDSAHLYRKMRSNLYWLPVLLTLCTVVCFTISYIMAVVRDDVYPFWPYISDTGTTVPESCIFGQLLNITALLAISTMYIRYKLVQAFNAHDRKLYCLNVFAIILGIISSLGVSLVANFQESSVIAVHFTGAFMAFGCGVAYCFVQTGISKHMYPMYSGIYIWGIRLAISLVGLVALITTGIFGGIASYQWNSNLNETRHSGHNDTHTNWRPDDPGYDAHVTSTASEWVMGIAFLIFFVTYVKDFQKISMRVVPELLVSHLDETPVVFVSENGGPTERTGLLAG